MANRAEHVAFVCPRFAEGTTVGGAETLLRHLAAAAAAAGRRVTFLTTCALDHFTWKNEVAPGTRTVDGMDVTFFPVNDNRDVGLFHEIQRSISRGRKIGDEDELAWLANSVNSSALCEALSRMSEQVDRIVAGPYLFGLTHAAAAVCPGKTFLVPCLHDEPFAHLAATRRLFHEVAGHVFNSEPERDLACRLYGLSTEDAAVVGIGVEPLDCDPGRFRDKRSLSAPYVLYSGRREPLKGTPLLIDYMTAFRKRTGRDVKLLLTGSGPIEIPPELEAHVVDAGFVSEQDKRDAMAGAVVFCHPSVNESLSIVLLEAWLAGTAALVHSGSEVLRFQCRRSGGGLWFGNYPEFEEMLSRLLDDVPLREKLAAAGRSYVQKEYAPGAVRTRLLEALDRQTAQRRPGGAEATPRLS